MSKKGKSKVASNPLALPADYKLREYRIIKVLGKGGFGITYLAEDLNLDKKVAIKELLPDGIATRGARRKVVPQSPDRNDDFEWARESFIDEARILADLQHPNIVGVMRLLEANSTAYMVMEYIEGEPLRERIKRKEPPAQVVVDEYMRAILSGLRRVHENDLLHRDIKPENILVRNHDRQPVLIDFGAARVQASGRSQHVTSIISPGYSPWEQYSTEVKLQGAWSDIYALSAVVYHWISGERPPESPNRVSQVNRDEPDPYVPLSSRAVELGYDESFLDAIDVGLAVRETDRPQSVAEWEIDLGLRAMTAAEMEAEAADGTSSGRRTTTSRTSSTASRPRPSKRERPGNDSTAATAAVAHSPNRWLIGALVVALASIIVLLVILIEEQRSTNIGSDSPEIASAGIISNTAGLGDQGPDSTSEKPGESTDPPSDKAPSKDSEEEDDSAAPPPPPQPAEPPAPTITVSTKLRSSRIEEGEETVLEIASKGGPLTKYPDTVSANGLAVTFQKEETSGSSSADHRYLYRVYGELAGSRTIPEIPLRAGKQDLKTDEQRIVITEPPPPPKTKEEIVRETILSYLAAGETNSNEDQTDYYADSVSYFGSTKSKYQIYQDYRTYVQRWPIRNYDVDGSISVDGYGDNWTANFELDYLTADGVIIKKGSADKRYGVRFVGETPEITRVETIREKSNESSLSNTGYDALIRFIDLFCETGSSNYTGSIRRSNLYDDHVDYFDKSLSRDGVARDQADWNSKLYSYFYNRTGNPTIRDLKERRIELVFDMEYQSNSSRGRKSGTVEVTLRVRYSTDANSFWIYYEKNRKI